MASGAEILMVAVLGGVLGWVLHAILTAPPTHYSDCEPK